MEVERKKVEFEKKDNEIIYSKSIKAGKRIYYLDVKKSRNEDMFLAITESKKRVTGSDQNIQVSYEKHKIFLYKEDFSKFVEGLEDVIDFIKRTQGDTPPREYTPYQKEVAAEKTVEDTTEEEVPEAKKGFFDKFKF